MPQLTLTLAFTHCLLFRSGFFFLSTFFFRSGFFFLSAFFFRSGFFFFSAFFFRSGFFFFSALSFPFSAFAFFFPFSFSFVFAFPFFFTASFPFFLKLFFYSSYSSSSIRASSCSGSAILTLMNQPSPNGFFCNTLKVGIKSEFTFTISPFKGAIKS